MESQNEDSRGWLAQKSLRESPFLKGLLPDEISNLLSHATQRKWNADEWICRQGDPARSVFLLTEGYARIYRASDVVPQKLLGVSAPGDLVGYDALVQNPNYLISARAAKPCRAVVWDAAAIRRLLLDYPRLALNVLGMVVSRLHNMGERSGSFAAMSAETRIARSLEHLAERIGNKTEHAIVINGFSAADLASLANTTVYTVSRVLSEWQRRGFIKKDRRRIILFRPDMLRTA